jgi:hypothetical protein
MRSLGRHQTPRATVVEYEYTPTFENGLTKALTLSLLLRSVIPRERLRQLTHHLLLRGTKTKEVCRRYHLKRSMKVDDGRSFWSS